MPNRTKNGKLLFVTNKQMENRQ